MESMQALADPKLKARMPTWLYGACKLAADLGN